MYTKDSIEISFENDENMHHQAFSQRSCQPLVPGMHHYTLQKIKNKLKLKLPRCLGSQCLQPNIDFECKEGEVESNEEAQNEAPIESEESESEDDPEELEIPFGLSFLVDCSSMKKSLSRWVQAFGKPIPEIWASVSTLDSRLEPSPLAASTSEACTILKERMQQLSVEEDAFGRLLRNRFALFLFFEVCITFHL